MKGYRFIVGYVLAVSFSLIAACLLMCSCGTKYVAVPEYHTEYVVRTDTFIQRDSVYRYDSVFVKVQGDTVVMERWATLYRDRWREKVVRDTIIKTDSIRVPYPVERKATFWEKTKQDAGLVTIALVMLAVVVLLGRYYIRSQLKK